MTALHNSAKDKQRWPLLNLIRQLLKRCDFSLTPKRISNGITKDGKKIYKRFYVIQKLNKI